MIELRTGGEWNLTERKMKQFVGRSMLVEYSSLSLCSRVFHYPSKNANIANFVLTVLFEIKKTNNIC